MALNFKKVIAKKFTDAKSTASNSVSTNSGSNGGNSKKTTTVTPLRYNSESFYKTEKTVDSATALNTACSSSIFAKGLKGDFSRMTGQINSFVKNEKWKVNLDIDGDGTTEDVTLLEAIKHDSELDLYVEKMMNKVLEKGHCSKCLTNESTLMELAMYGIRIDSIGSSDKVTNRVYAGTLIDVDDEIRELMLKENKTEEDKRKIYAAVYSKDAKVVKDSEGHTANHVYADALIPDGYAQAAEIELTSIIDMMGYDSISKADFIGRESEYDKLMASIGSDYLNGTLHKINEGQEATSISEFYGNMMDIKQSVKNLWGGSGSAPGYSSAGGGGGGSYDESGVGNAGGFNELSSSNPELYGKVKEYIASVYSESDSEDDAIMNRIKTSVKLIFDIELSDNEISAIIS